MLLHSNHKRNNPGPASFIMGYSSSLATTMGLVLVLWAGRCASSYDYFVPFRFGCATNISITIVHRFKLVLKTISFRHTKSNCELAHVSRVLSFVIGKCISFTLLLHSCLKFTFLDTVWKCSTDCWTASITQQPPNNKQRRQHTTTAPPSCCSAVLQNQ